MLARSLFAAIALVFANPTTDIGRPPPALDAVAWYGSPPVTLDELKGKCVLVEVIRTDSDLLLAKLPQVAARLAKDEASGLFVLGVTSQEPAEIDRFFERRKPGFPIVALKDDSWIKGLQWKGLPWEAVIDSSGNLVASDFMGDSALSAAMKSVKPSTLWPKKFAKCASLLRTSKFLDAWGVLATLKAAANEGPEKAALERFTTYCEEFAAREREAAIALHEAGLAAMACSRVSPIANAKPPFAVSADAAKLLAQIQAMPDFDKEKKAGDAYLAALEKEEDQEYLAAYEAFRELTTKFKGTKCAEAATKHAGALVSTGMAGYDKHCSACTRGGKACDSHAKKVK